MPSHEDYLDSLLRNMEHAAEPESTKQEDVSLPADIMPEMEEELPADILSDIGEELPADIMSEIEEELPADIMSEIEEELPADIMSEMEEELPADIMPEMEEELPADILSDIGEELPADIMSEIEEELPADIMSEIEEELPADIMSEIEEELPADIFSDIKEELPADIMSEIEEELPADIMSDIEEELPADIMSEIEEELPADILSDFGEMTESDEGLDINLDSLSDLEAVSGMSEDEIEKILAASAEESQEQTDEDSDVAEMPSDEDLLGMIEGTEDGDLLDIQDMLEKADNNEAVGEEIEALLHGVENPEPLEASSILDTENEKVKSAQDKKRQRQEKAAARKAAKAAAKEAKAAAKAAAKQAKEPAVSLTQPSEKVEEARPDDMLSRQEIDTLLLDTIVSEADQAGLGDEAKYDAEDFGGDLNEENTADSEPAIEEEAAAESNDDDLGFDIGSLFGDGDDSSLGLDLESMSENDSAFPDFVDLESGDVDSALPDFENEGKKKKGLLSRFFDMLTEEDEDEESESLRLSDENKNILNDLDKEKNAKKKKKKVKKPGPGQGDGDGEDGGKGGKAKKAKKAKKPKPEKPKKEPEPEPLIPEKKLSLKKVLPVLLVCASLGVLLVVFANATVDFTDKQNAKEAYYAGDYQTCYENLFGKDLNESEQIMFGTSESILYIRLWLREYEMFAEAGEEVEALDSLIQTVANYPHLYIYAVQWNAGEEVMAGYESILNILYEKYGLTEAQAQEIAAVRSNYEYTRRVVAIVQGKPYGYWDEPAVVETEPEEPMRDPLPDELPEESDLEEGQYIGN